MKQLSVTVAALRAAFEENPEVWQPELAIIDRIEKMEWRGKRAGRMKVLDIHQLGLDFGAGFAMTALRFADPRPLANQIARFLCLDVAGAALRAHPGLNLSLKDGWQETLRDFIAGNGDLTTWEGWCQAVRREGERRGEVAERIAGRITAAVCGRGDFADIYNGGLDGLLDAVDDLQLIFMRGDERYTAARRIADLANEIEARWQAGTRLKFAFAGAIDDAMEALEDQLLPDHEYRALGVVWAAFVWHTRGESIPPRPPKPALAESGGE